MAKVTAKQLKDFIEWAFKDSTDDVALTVKEVWLQDAEEYIKTKEQGGGDKNE